MRVLVVNVRVVLVFVSHRRVAMPVGVLAFSDDAIFVQVLMMLVMDMFMAVLQEFVGVGMAVPFGQVEPHAETHQRPCDQ